MFTDILLQKNNSVDRVLTEINDADGREQFRLDDVGKKLFAQRLHRAPHMLAVKHPLMVIAAQEIGHHLPGDKAPVFAMIFPAPALLPPAIAIVAVNARVLVRLVRQFGVAGSIQGGMEHPVDDERIPIQIAVEQRYQQLLFQGLSLVPEALPQIEGVGVHTVIGMALDTPQIADGLAVDSVFRRGLR